MDELAARIKKETEKAGREKALADILQAFAVNQRVGESAKSFKELPLYFAGQRGFVLSVEGGATYAVRVQEVSLMPAGVCSECETAKATKACTECGREYCGECASEELRRGKCPGCRA